MSLYSSPAAQHSLTTYQWRRTEVGQAAFFFSLSHFSFSSFAVHDFFTSWTAQEIMSLSLRDGGFAQQNTVMAGRDELQKSLGLVVSQALSFWHSLVGVQHSRRVIRIALCKTKSSLKQQQQLVLSRFIPVCHYYRTSSNRSFLINTFNVSKRYKDTILPPQRFLKRTPHRSALHLHCIAAHKREVW